MAIIKVGVLRGGPSDEHEVSLKTGEAVLLGLSDKYKPHDIFLDKKGQWHIDGMPDTIDRVLRFIDVVFNALHGQFGEDGKVQQILEHYKIPYTGSQIISSAMGMNKVLARDAFAKAGLNIPRAIIINGKTTTAGEAAEMIFRTMSPAWVVKPTSSGSSVGVSIVNSYQNLIPAIDEALRYDSKVLVEEYIKGREATCGIIDNFRDEKNYSLPVAEIIPPPEHKFFNYEAKYSGQSREICPGNFDQIIKKEIEEMARQAHNALGCRHYSRSDFIVSDRPGKEKVYLLEINTLPGMTKESLLPKAIEAIGCSYSDFLDHLIQMALKKNN